jgi:hypothetical protein
MRKNLYVLLAVMAVSLALAAQAFSANAQRRDGESRDLAERDEINEKYELLAGARVEVRGVNGTVDIETSSGSMAEVHIVRSARSREELNNRRLIVEHTANSLVIRPERENERGDHNVRQRVTLRIPRAVDLNVSGVNGRTNVGEIDGPVRLSGINGAVEVGQAVGYSHISGINGRVRINIARLGERGIEVSGINGGVELRFDEDLNADLDVSGINGSVNTDVANVTVVGKFSRQNFRAKIGAGGTPITVKGVNGTVRLSRVGSAG